MFQFPSNGKAHSDMSTGSSIMSSIFMRFNSLQTGRHIQTVSPVFASPWGGCFHSLQTGRHIQTYRPLIRFGIAQDCFNSLQTGRHIQTYRPLIRFGIAQDCFNSLQTGRHIQTYRPLIRFGIAQDCFNSLQTGRHIQTYRLRHGNERWVHWFQFPSNGKAHSDMFKNNIALTLAIVLFQFPSNGKAHSDLSKLTWVSAMSRRSFNSLQTGRHIQTHYRM